MSTLSDAEKHGAENFCYESHESQNSCAKSRPGRSPIRLKREAEPHYRFAKWHGTRKVITPLCLSFPAPRGSADIISCSVPDL
jgi:hypothetical protein